MALLKMLRGSAVRLMERGVLISGDDNCGKSTTCLELIKYFKAQLIADDYCGWDGNALYALTKTAGQLELADVGIITLPYCCERVPLALVVVLDPQYRSQRLPEKQLWQNTMIPCLHLPAFSSHNAMKIWYFLQQYG